MQNGKIIWKNIFEYHTNGMLDNDEFAELMDVIYWYTWDMDSFNAHKMSPKVGLIWQTLGAAMKEGKRKVKWKEKHAMENELIKENKAEIDEIISVYTNGETEKANGMLHKMFFNSGFTADCAETQSIIDYINNRINQ